VAKNPGILKETELIKICPQLTAYFSRALSSTDKSGRQIVQREGMHIGPRLAD